MKLTRLPRRILAPVLVIAIIANCGGSALLKSFRVALTSSRPLVSSLVAAGAFPQSKADDIITDFNDGAQCGLTLQDAFTAAKELPASEQKQAKFQASSAALQCFRVIINHQNFAANQRVQNIANIAEGVLASLVIFYAPPGRGAGRPPAHAVTAGSEKELEEKLKAKVDEIERLMKPTN